MIMVIEMMRANIYCLIYFPVEDGVSSTIGPGHIITGHIPDYDLHCRLSFGAYIQVHNKGNNTMMSRTAGALVLCSMGNDQGGYYFLSLNTGRKITGRSWTLTTLADVVKRVNAISRKMRFSNKLTFQHRDLSKVQDNSSNNDITAGVHDDTNEDNVKYSYSEISNSNSSSNNDSNSNNSNTWSTNRQ